jgi:hypothetical protein
MSYQTIYGVGLLDDLHNYFPALLYEQDRFLNLTHVFHYIRTQMNQRFNLYSYGRNMYNEQSQDAPQTIPTVRITPVDVEDNLATTNLLLSLLSLGSGLQPARRQANPFTPVVVRPSLETINANTTLLSGSEVPPNTNCSICQDVILATDSCRKIRACNHVYHRACIDQWFERSVFCPTCRHDIRS